jgi:hypothetical protein
MLKAVLALFLLAGVALPATQRLYMKEGGYHLVREYEVIEDRVRYYSTERGDWEEIPLELIDLEKTKREFSERKREQEADVAALQAEDESERAMEREVSRIPIDSGVYRVEGGQAKAITQAELKVGTNRRRSVLKVITPIPVVAGKHFVEVEGKQSATRVSNAQPEFYIRLSALQRFGMFKLTPRNNDRVVQIWNVVPVSDEVIEEQEEVEVFRQQVGDGLYKIWPMNPLEPGEYAVVEYSQGARNIMAWDFSYRPEGASAEPAKAEKKGRKR